MAGEFEKHSEDFNCVARDVTRNGKNPDSLLTRYSVLLRHKAGTEEEKDQLVGALYDSGAELMKAYTGPNGKRWVDDAAASNVTNIFAALRRPESLRHLPMRAPDDLADIALDLLTKVDKTTDSGFASYNHFHAYVTRIHNFARIALETADAYRAEMGSQDIDIKTGKPIAASKRIMLKKEGPETTP